MAKELHHELWAAPIERDAVRVVGADSRSYLHGQLSQDIEALAVGESSWSFVLQPQGKVDAWVGVARLSEDEFVLDVDAGFGATLLARLERFKLRVKVEQELVDGMTAVAVRGRGAHRVIAGGGGAPGLCYTRRVAWPGVEGVDILAVGAIDTSALRSGAGEPLPLADAATLGELRVRRGVPAMGSEITDKTIPAELGQWVIDASVSFTKGCYTGQELVARIDSRGGHVPRHLRVVEIEGGVAVPVGAELAVAGTAAGALTSVAGASALAFVPRSIEGPVGADLSWDGGTARARIVE